MHLTARAHTHTQKKTHKKKTRLIMYLLQCFSLFRTQVSDSSAHVSGQRMLD